MYTCICVVCWNRNDAGGKELCSVALSAPLWPINPKPYNPTTLAAEGNSHDRGGKELCSVALSAPHSPVNPKPKTYNINHKP